jgi:hypothetical protein
MSVRVMGPPGGPLLSLLCREFTAVSSQSPEAEQAR